MSDAAYSNPLDLRKVETRAWFETLRDRIHALRGIAPRAAAASWA
jgi:hypothetical protein